jgi:hypothetical protein
MRVFNFFSFRNIKKNEKGDLEFTKPLIENFKNVTKEQSSFIITKELEMRPDLISNLVTEENEDFSDMILKQNGLGCFTEIRENMIIEIPNVNSVLAQIKKTNQKQENQSKKELNKKLPIKDKQRLLEIIEINEIRTPNMVAEGSSPIEVSNGVIELGTDVVSKKCKQDLTKSQLISEQIKKAIKDKIKNQNDQTTNFEEISNASKRVEATLFFNNKQAEKNNISNFKLNQSF